MRNEVTSFRQGEDESIFDTWERFKELLRQCLYHGIPICIQLEIFYNGLVPSSRNMLDALSGGALLSKSYEEGYKLIESITANTYQWPVTRELANSNQKRPIGIHEVTETITFTAQIIKLRSRKECGAFTPRNNQSSEKLSVQDNSQDEVKSTKEPSSEGHNEENVDKNATEITSNSEKQLEVVSSSYF
ncbi:hypothetical protein KIW84_042087 [Lathyrus oleraceus]|uniref:Retrotransposon gag protein n=1 Tax=Pisum sativum TaxID=3888 RepID=A0A9D4XA32_PEA|nr:hypothetical protein KIW84_042087 [Pisum sativum]